MPTKTWRTVQDAKFSGTFTKEQIDRAIRIVEKRGGPDRGTDPSPPRDRGGSSDKRSHGGSSGVKR